MTADGGRPPAGSVSTETLDALANSPVVEDRPDRDEPRSGLFERLHVPGDGPAATAPLDPAGSTRRPLYRADPDRVLRILSANQFEDPFLAFRELYANALDAVRGRREARIGIRVGADRVIVEDSGAGLDEVGLEALTTLGSSTRRGSESIGRFGIGFASVFDPQLGVARVEFTAARAGVGGGVRLEFLPDVSGGVSIRLEDGPMPRGGGSRVEVVFDAARAPEDRVARTVEVLETHAAYSGVETELNGRILGQELADYIRQEIKLGAWSSVERALVAATAVRGPVGVAAIDPARSESKFRVYHRGLFVCELPLNRVQGRPWPRGVFGAIHAEGVELVASRNAFVENERFEGLQEELRRLAYEAAYRVVRYYEQSQDGYARIVLLDALRRGLRSTSPEGLLAESDDLFSSAVVRSPMFRAWGTKRMFSFEELVELKARDRFRAFSTVRHGGTTRVGPFFARMTRSNEISSASYPACVTCRPPPAPRRSRRPTGGRCSGPSPVRPARRVLLVSACGRRKECAVGNASHRAGDGRVPGERGGQGCPRASPPRPAPPARLRLLPKCVRPGRRLPAPRDPLQYGPSHHSATVSSQQSSPRGAGASSRPRPRARPHVSRASRLGFLSDEPRDSPRALVAAARIDARAATAEVPTVGVDPQPTEPVL